MLSLRAASQFAVFSAAFAFIVAGIAEWLGLRSPGYWLAAGTGIALLGFVAQYTSEVSGQQSILNGYALQSYLTAGFFGGLVYWLVAGVRSGSTRAVAAAGSEAPPLPHVVVAKAERPKAKLGSLAEKIDLNRGAPAKQPGEGAAPPPAPASAPAVASAPALPAAAKGASAPVARTTAVPVTKPAKVQPPVSTSGTEPDKSDKVTSAKPTGSGA